MKYANPHHPAGPLYSQEAGFLLGSGGYAQSSDDPRVLVPANHKGEFPHPSDLAQIGADAGADYSAGAMHSSGYRVPR